MAQPSYHDAWLGLLPALSADGRLELMHLLLSTTYLYQHGEDGGSISPNKLPLIKRYKSLLGDLRQSPAL